MTWSKQPLKDSTNPQNEEFMKLQKDNEILLERITVLEHMLAEARRWMEREVQTRTKEIQTKLATKSTIQALNEVFASNSWDQDTQWAAVNLIREYFGSYLDTLPHQFFAYLIEAERLYYILTTERGFNDGLPIISVLTKAYDCLIHEIITKSFVKYARDRLRWEVPPKFNDPLERALIAMVTKNYTLSIGRITPLLSRIRDHRENGVTLLPYTQIFADWIKWNESLEKNLLSEPLRKKLVRLNESEIFGEKRHRSSINHDEVREARSLLLGNYENQQSIFMLLVKIGK